MKKVIFASALAVVASSSFAVELWNNGPLVTHVGAGAGGANVSMASAVPNTGGSNITATAWRADDFTVSGGGWLVNTISSYGYDTNNNPPRFGAGTVSIRQGAVDGTVVASVAATWSDAGIYRVFNGAANLTNTARRLFHITGNFGGLSLADGTYWVTFSMSNTAAANNWMPYVMDPNSGNPDDPITRIGNSQFSGDSGSTWSLATVTTGSWNQAPELPFTVEGDPVPEPATMIGLGAGVLALMRRRRAVKA